MEEGGEAGLSSFLHPVPGAVLVIVIRRAKKQTVWRSQATIAELDELRPAHPCHPPLLILAILVRDLCRNFV